MGTASYDLDPGLHSTDDFEYPSLYPPSHDLEYPSLYSDLHDVSHFFHFFHPFYFLDQL